MMTDLLSNLGNLTMKSIEILVHIDGGIGRVWSVLGVLIVSPLLCWQVSHSVTKVCMSCFMPSQKKERLIRSYVL
jgi:hypothetical protein